MLGQPCWKATPVFAGDPDKKLGHSYCCTNMINSPSGMALQQGSQKAFAELKDGE
jgi:hypothetical protein